MRNYVSAWDARYCRDCGREMPQDYNDIRCEWCLDHRAERHRVSRFDVWGRGYEKVYVLNGIEYLPCAVTREAFRTFRRAWAVKRGRG